MLETRKTVNPHMDIIDKLFKMIMGNIKRVAGSK